MTDSQGEHDQSCQRRVINRSTDSCMKRHEIDKLQLCPVLGSPLLFDTIRRSLYKQT
jgi:hypothetical protein